MVSLLEVISARMQAVTHIDPELRLSTKPAFGHYQCNVALRLAKETGRNPRDIAK
jgi:arginyl-tRNA synthetase